jgi:hypothetical protein
MSIQTDRTGAGETGMMMYARGVLRTIVLKAAPIQFLGKALANHAINIRQGSESSDSVQTKSGNDKILNCHN